VKLISGDLTPAEEAEESSGTATERRAPIGALILPPPTVAKLDPEEVHVHSERTVTIHGENLARVHSVSFGGTPAVSFTEIDDTELTAVAPSRGEGRVDVRVTTAAGESPISGGDVLNFGYEPPLGSTDGNGSNSGGAGGTSIVPPGPGPTQKSTPATCKVPQLKGRTAKAAKQAIRKADCEVGTVTVTAGAGAAKG
jgi:hypothetical protein